MSESLASFLVARLRPRAGWPIAMLAFAAAAMPGIAAGEASLPLPANVIVVAGLVGAALGLRLARPLGSFWRAVQLAAALAIGAVLLVAAGGAMPPPGLVAQDLATAMSLLGGSPPAQPQLLTGRYLALSLPRLWGALGAAPDGGRAGAALLVGSLAVLTTWLGALILGWAAGGLRRSLGWVLPLLVALSLTSILGGADGAGLVIGLALLLMLFVALGGAARERRWEREGYAYSDLLRPAALAWGGGSALVAVTIALAIPTSLPNFAAVLPAAELPSGLAEIEGQVQRGRPTARAEPGLSTLPAIALGVSLSQDAPETVSLRITLDQPIDESPYPRYWRVRVLNLYTGRSWTTNAMRGPFGGFTAGEPPPGAILQRVEDLRAEPGLLAALPNVVTLDRPAVAERLPDGSLAALEAELPSASYNVASFPQELATPHGQGSEPPPSYADTLGLPASVTQRVRDLARTIAGEGASPDAAALALESYLRGLPYSYEVRPLPRQGDAVDQFLFEMGQGYCTYYASAMAVMARSLGIPARVAVGYATGEYDPASGSYTVREGDAHAWPELLIGGRWLPFEPTPIRPLPARAAPADATAVPAPLPEELVTPEPGVASLWWALAGFGVAGGLAGAWVVARRRRPTLVATQLWLEALGRRAGVPWPTGATLHEYGRLLVARGAVDGPLLAELVGLIEAARYGRHPLDPAEARRLRRALADTRRRRVPVHRG